MVGKPNAFRVRFHAVVSFFTTAYIGLVWILAVWRLPLINPGKQVSFSFVIPDSGFRPA